MQNSESELHCSLDVIYNLHYLMLALGMDDEHGPPDVINGIPLKVATPLSSVKRCCSRETQQLFLHRGKHSFTEHMKAILRGINDNSNTNERPLTNSPQP